MQKIVDVAEALQCKYPDPVVLVVTQNTQGRPNIMAASWFMLASDEPWMFVLGIDEGAYTCTLVKQTREFVVVYPHSGMAAAVRYVGTHHGHRMDKIKHTGLRLQNASIVKAPLLADAMANFECRLVRIFRPGNCPLIVGKIVAAHVNRQKGRKRLFNLGKGYQLGTVKPV